MLWPTSRASHHSSGEQFHGYRATCRHASRDRRRYQPPASPTCPDGRGESNGVHHHRLASWLLVAKLLSFARDPDKLGSLAQDLGGSAGTPADADAVAFGDVVVISVPWSAVPFALEQAGGLQGKVVIDTTNQFGSGLMPVNRPTGGRRRDPGLAARAPARRRSLGRPRIGRGDLQRPWAMWYVPPVAILVDLGHGVTQFAS